MFACRCYSSGSVRQDRKFVGHRILEQKKTKQNTYVPQVTKNGSKPGVGAHGALHQHILCPYHSVTKWFRSGCIIIVVLCCWRGGRGRGIPIYGTARCTSGSILAFLCPSGFGCFALDSRPAQSRRQRQGYLVVVILLLIIAPSAPQTRFWRLCAESRFNGGCTAFSASSHLVWRSCAVKMMYCIIVYRSMYADSKAAVDALPPCCRRLACFTSPRERGERRKPSSEIPEGRASSWYIC